MEPHRHSNNRRADTNARSGPTATIDRAWLENKALRYVARWEASSASVKALLERKIEEHNDGSQDTTTATREIPAIVDDLIARGFVDDRRFAEVAFARARREGKSARHIRGRLLEKKIATAVIDQLFEQEADETSGRAEEIAALQFARRKRLGPYRQEAEQRSVRRDRDLAALGRQGFEPDLACKIIDADSIGELE